MSLFTVESTEAHVPITTKTAHDPALVSLLNDTLKPRGIPTPDGQAVKLSTPTKEAATAVVAGLRALRDEDKDSSYSPRARVTPVDKDNKEGAQSVVLWLDNRITRQRKPKPAEGTETPAVEETPAETPAVEFSEGQPAEEVHEESHRRGFGRR